MDEVFPILAGLLLGVVFAGPRVRALWARALLVVAAGVAATVFSGEYVENWAFALVDIGEVGLCAWIGGAVAHRVGGRFGAWAGVAPPP